MSGLGFGASFECEVHSAHLDGRLLEDAASKRTDQQTVEGFALDEVGSSCVFLGLEAVYGVEETGEPEMALPTKLVVGLHDEEAGMEGHGAVAPAIDDLNDGSLLQGTGEGADFRIPGGVLWRIGENGPNSGGGPIDPDVCADALWLVQEKKGGERGNEEASEEASEEETEPLPERHRGPPCYGTLMPGE